MRRFIVVAGAAGVAAAAMILPPSRTNRTNRTNRNHLPVIVPVPSASLMVRRDNLLNMIREYCDRPNNNLLLVTGLTGVGKSTLVRQATQGKHGQYVNLSGSGVDPHHLQKKITHLLTSSKSLPMLVVDIDHESDQIQDIAGVHTYVRSLAVQGLVRAIMIVHESKAHDIYAMLHTKTIRVSDLNAIEANEFMDLHRMFMTEEGRIHYRRRIIDELGTRLCVLHDLRLSLVEAIHNKPNDEQWILDTDSCPIDVSDISRDTLDSFIKRHDQKAAYEMTRACRTLETRNHVNRVLRGEKIADIEYDRSIMTLRLPDLYLDFRSHSHRRAAESIHMKNSFVK